MSDHRKRPLPSTASGFPSKRSSRLSVGMDRLDINNGEGPSQNTSLDDPMQEELEAADSAQPSEAQSSASSSVVFIRATNAHSEPYTPDRPQMILQRLANPTVSSSLATKFAEHNAPPSIRKYPTDPRDIKSVDTQRRYALEIADYLNKLGFREFVPQFKNARSPPTLSSKDFYYIFTHLVQHYDPSLRNKNKIEDHVIEIMSSLKYPLRDSISRKSLLSIGAIHSNPNFWGLLQWLMEACKARDVSDPREFKDPPLAELEIEENAMASAFAEFSFAAYRKYISSEEEPNYEEEMEPLRKRFDEISDARDRDIQVLEAELAELDEEIAMLESDESTLDALKKKNHDLTRDAAKFRNYCHEKRKRVEKYKSINKVVEEEVDRLVSENNKLEEQKVVLEANMREKNVTLAELETLAKEHEAESKKFSDLKTHLETRQLAYNEKMETLAVLRDKVRKQVDEFNTKVKKLFPTGQEQQEFLLIYNPGAKTAEEMLSYNVDEKLIPVLEKLEAADRQDLEQLTIETQRLREKTDVLNADMEQTQMDLVEKQKEVEAKAKKLEENKRQFMEENERYNIMTEKHEKALDDERSRSRDALLLAKERYFAEEEKCKDMERKFQEEQDVLTATAKKLNTAYEESQKEIQPLMEDLLQLVIGKEHNSEE